MKIIIISAIASNNVIGRTDGKMPWHVPEEFKHFKQTTMGHPVLMGRKTFETLGKPLRGRENIIITRDIEFKVQFDDVVIKNSLHDAIEYCRNNGEEKIFIIGGGEIYRQAISFADELVLSFMKFEAEGDVHFPLYNKEDWEIVSKESFEKFDIVYLRRK